MSTAPPAPTDLDDHLDRAYASILATMVDTGVAPHYTAVAGELGLPMDDGRAIVHRLMELTPGWTHPGTDYIASFPPFNNQPTQYRITIDGKPGWYGQ